MTGAQLAVVPFVRGASEAARLIDAEARHLASIVASVGPTLIDKFREVTLTVALDYAGGAAVAGVHFAACWGGGGVMLT